MSDMCPSRRRGELGREAREGGGYWTRSNEEGDTLPNSSSLTIENRLWIAVLENAPLTGCSEKDEEQYEYGERVYC